MVNVKHYKSQLKYDEVRVSTFVLAICTVYMHFIWPHYAEYTCKHHRIFTRFYALSYCSNIIMYSSVMFSLIYFRVASLALGQSRDCPNASKLSMKDTWWRHQMETFFASMSICAGNSSVTSEFPAQRPVTRSFDAFFDMRLNKRLSK